MTRGEHYLRGMSGLSLANSLVAGVTAPALVLVLTACGGEDGVTVTDENGDEATIGTQLSEVEGTPEEAQEEALGMLTDAGFTGNNETSAKPRSTDPRR
jgi:hypothetical protein